MSPLYFYETSLPVQTAEVMLLKSIILVIMWKSNLYGYFVTQPAS
jgi:hypothetical protein